MTSINISLLLPFLILGTVYAVDEVSFLSQFGYLPKTEGGSSSMISMEIVEEGIREYQRNFNLRETGKMDSQTRYLMSLSRCGVEDKQDHGLVNRLRLRVRRSTHYKWDMKEITYNVVSGSHRIPKGDVRRIMANAFKFWEKHVDIKFRETSDKEAVMQIDFSTSSQHNTCPYMFESYTLAHAFKPIQLEVKLGGDIHFYDVHEWSTKEHTEQSGVPSLQSVAIHEIGHTLGLDHNTHERDSIMFPMDQPNPNKKLTHYDLQRLHRLYGPPPGQEDPRNTPRLPPRHPLRPIEPTKGTTNTKGVTTAVDDGVVTIGHEDSIRPHPCRSGADAVFTWGKEFFVFKGDWYWRVSNNGSDGIHGPHLISHEWKGLPSPIDAVVRIKHYTYFFVGRKVYKYQHRTLLHSPQDISTMGIPKSIERIELAYNYVYQQLDGLNTLTYLWTKGKNGSEYWLLNREKLKVEATYPRPVKYNWEHVPADPDAAFSFHTDLYFVKGHLVYKVNTTHYSNPIDDGFPLPLGVLWNSCKKDYVLNKRLQSMNYSNQLISYLTFAVLCLALL